MDPHPNDDLTDERRAEMRDRIAKMTPKERRRFTTDPHPDTPAPKRAKSSPLQKGQMFLVGGVRHVVRSVTHRGDIVLRVQQ